MGAKSTEGGSEKMGDAPVEKRKGVAEGIAGKATDGFGIADDAVAGRGPIDNVAYSGQPE